MAATTCQQAAISYEGDHAYSTIRISSGDITCRPITKADADFYKHIFTDETAMQQHLYRSPQTEEWINASFNKWISLWLEDYPLSSFVIERGGTPIGYFAIEAEGRPGVAQVSFVLLEQEPKKQALLVQDLANVIQTYVLHLLATPFHVPVNGDKLTQLVLMAESSGLEHDLAKTLWMEPLDMQQKIAHLDISEEDKLPEGPCLKLVRKIANSQINANLKLLLHATKKAYSHLLCHLHGFYRL